MYTIEMTTASDTNRRILARSEASAYAHDLYDDVKAALAPHEDLYLMHDDKCLAACTRGPDGEVTECSA